MAREQLFEERRTWATKDDDPALSFQGMELPTANPVPGKTYKLAITLEAHENNVFYVIITRDPGKETEKEIHEFSGLSLNNQVTEVQVDLPVPEGAENVEVAVEAGYEA